MVPGGSHTTPVVQCQGPKWPSTEEGGNQGHPSRRRAPSPSCLPLDPQMLSVLVRGARWFREPWRGATSRLFFSVFFSAFSVSPSAPTRERPRAGGAPSQDAALNVCGEKSRGVLAERAKAPPPSLGSSMDFPLFLTVAGWVCCPFFLVFFFQCSLVEPTLPEGAPLEL